MFEQARHFSETRGWESVGFSLASIVSPRAFEVEKFPVSDPGGVQGELFFNYLIYFLIAVRSWAGPFFSMPMTMVEDEPCALGTA